MKKIKKKIVKNDNSLFECVHSPLRGKVTLRWNCKIGLGCVLLFSYASHFVVLRFTSHNPRLGRSVTTANNLPALFK